MEIWFDTIAIVALVFASGFFAAAEIAVVSVRRSRIQELIEQNHRNADAVKKLLDDPDKFFAIVQIGMTVFPSMASALGGVLAVEYLKPLLQSIQLSWVQHASETIAVTAVVILISYFTLVVGELAPKSLGLTYAEQFSLFSARFLLWLLRVSSFMIRFLSGSTNLILRPFKDKTSFIESHISEEEFKLMLEEGTRTGVIDKTEHELIKSIFEFTDTTANEIMVTRTDVVAIDIDQARERIIKRVMEEGYTRMPVYKGNIDNIVGVVYTKDIISLMEHPELIIIQDIIRPAYFVPDTKKISQLLREFQARRVHLAIVVDEFGGMEGIITMEDILEEIVGEIHDEYDEEHKDFEMVPGGGVLVNGRMYVKDFNARFERFQIPEGEDYDTVAGFIIKVAGRIPGLNEKITYNKLQFTVTKRAERRVRQVKIEHLSP
jgi:putative hemolysin